ncbi:MAG TPA: Na+/H+ antiporter subunit E [Variovorax sp.]
MTPDPAGRPAPALPSTARITLARALLFALLWAVLMPSAKAADLAVGLIAVALATWTSLRLLPPRAGHVRMAALLAFVPHFLWQSVLAGVDVARRALSPRMRLRPGFIDYRVGFPPGLARNEFASITSLMPGTVPVADEEGHIVIHCLDVGAPVAEQMAAEERRLKGALVAGERHD